MKQFNMKQQHLGYIVPSIGCNMKQFKSNMAHRWDFYLIKPYIETSYPLKGINIVQNRNLNGLICKLDQISKQEKYSL